MRRYVLAPCELINCISVHQFVWTIAQDMAPQAIVMFARIEWYLRVG
jgi:hypothetical protein